MTITRRGILAVALGEAMRRPFTGASRRGCGFRPAPGLRIHDPGADYLATFAQNPIPMDGTTTSVETTDWDAVDRRIFVNGFRVVFTDAGPAAEVRRLCEAPGGTDYLGLQAGVRSYRLRKGGASTNWTFATAYGTADLNYIEVDWYSREIRFGSTTDALSGTDTPDANSPVTIVGDEWWTPGVQITWGSTAGLTVPWDGDIYQPTGLRASSMGGSGLTLVGIAGQSNARGSSGDSPTDASLFTAYADCRFFHNVYQVVPVSQFVTEDMDNLGTIDAFGVELSLARSMVTNEAAGDVGIVKAARGATSLAVDWLPTSEGGPGPELENFLHALSEGHAAMERDSQAAAAIKAVIWIQGEADSSVEAQANAYEANQAALFAEIRAHVGDPSLPIIDWQLRSTVGTYYATVQAAKTAVSAADPHTYLYDPSSLSPFDGVHYQADALDTGGDDMGTTLYTTIGI